MSQEATAFCVMDAAGKVLARGKVASGPEALFEVVREHCPCPSQLRLKPVLHFVCEFWDRFIPDALQVQFRITLPD